MKWFSISDMLHSDTAVARRIWNGADIESERNMVSLIENVLDPACERYGKRVHISSGYRNPELNRLVGGQSQSLHQYGMAADLYTDEGPQGNLELGRIIIALGKFDQIIFEQVPGTNLLPKWIHVSWKRNGVNRRDIRKKVVGSSGYPTIDRKEVLGL